MNDVKDAVLELSQQLPEECTWDEVMYRIFVRQKIDDGLKDAHAGRTIPHEEVFQEFTSPSSMPRGTSQTSRSMSEA